MTIKINNQTHHVGYIKRELELKEEEVEGEMQPVVHFTIAVKKRRKEKELLLDVKLLGPQAKKLCQWGDRTCLIHIYGSLDSVDGCLYILAHKYELLTFKDR